MLKIHAADEKNADYGRIRMFQALQYQKEIGELGKVAIPSEGTVRKIMEQIHLIHKPKRKPNGITKADREARKSDDLLKRDFTADAPLQKCVTDITEIPAKDGKLYVSAIFDCCDLLPVGLAVFHELLEQPQDLLVHWRASSCCKAAKILRNDCRCTLRFIILVGNVSSVIDNFNFNMSHVKSPEASALKAAAIQDIEIQKEDITVKFCEGVPIDKETEAYFHLQ